MSHLVKELAAKKYKPEIIPPGDDFKATEYVLDGVIASGVVFLAAAAGAGKTTALLALAMRVAGLIQDEVFTASIKRKVIIFSEHATQIEEIIAAMVSEGVCGQASYQDVRQAIILANAVRMSVADIQDCAEFVDAGNYDTENYRGSKIYMAKPFVIFDTSNANFDLENENDSQAIGTIVATVKTEFFIKRAIPTLTATHTAKTLKHGEGDSLSARGSSAIEGDAHQVIYLSTVKGGVARLLEIEAGKHRFHAKTDAIKLISAIGEVKALDSFGDLITYPVTYIAKMEPTTKEQRDIEKIKAAERIKNLKSLASENEIRREILDAMTRWPNLPSSLTDSVIPTKEKILSKIPKAKQLVGEVFDVLVGEGHIIGHVIDAAKKNQFKGAAHQPIHNRIQTYYWLKERGDDFFG